MLTITCEPTVSENTTTAQIETLPSDAEISRRVLQIRSSWSLSERVERRHEADRRFETLIEQLSICEAA
ncbi:hypothetical protein K227x_11940 [Rubripirellula lacrimiformis]|uniref:Uncharacterized protein n=1 Tax=Rubripirellula lacrimiformis TaxID=1930273 RepID=A0A517N6P5_9BACT|nr:hypothetical protein [Rubripirellula lacrimiformis]QDT02816.1 hypothetical protein K227x_11940 [Rubripirellula lacrimiformis]